MGSRSRIGRLARTAMCAGMVLGAALTGCTPLATYPPIPGSNTVEPWVAPVPQAMAEAINYTHIRVAPIEPLYFNLPPMVPTWVWEQVARDVGRNAQIMTADGMKALSVEQVRVNGGKAEVDVAYPTPEGMYQLVTLGMELDPFQPPRVVFENRWRFSVDPPVSNWDARQLPHYSRDAGLGDSSD